MCHYEKLLPLAEGLREQGFDVELPEKTLAPKTKREHIETYLEKLKNADILLLGNVEGYVGVSTFFEAGWAYALGKPIFALETIDANSDYHEDLAAIDVVELDGDFDKMKGAAK
jgi:nucleoside 2-deoxyribosyltransferase